jgi:hypothetical protein
LILAIDFSAIVAADLSDRRAEGRIFRHEGAIVKGHITLRLL